ncbi:helix-turn-helix domain-containing protein [Streptomyces sp. NPDC001553]|uniref:helix-turn-helix domain-containing protein n=1 Tax=Streptomyces sp. NPDC001553 TaxID=3154385 RepID=UPI00331E57E1
MVTKSSAEQLTAVAQVLLLRCELSVYPVGRMLPALPALAHALGISQAEVDIALTQLTGVRVLRPWPGYARLVVTPQSVWQVRRVPGSHMARRRAIQVCHQLETETSMSPDTTTRAAMVRRIITTHLDAARTDLDECARRYLLRHLAAEGWIPPTGLPVDPPETPIPVTATSPDVLPPDTSPDIDAPLGFLTEDPLDEDGVVLDLSTGVSYTDEKPQDRDSLGTLYARLTPRHAGLPHWRHQQPTPPCVRCGAPVDVNHAGTQWVVRPPVGPARWPRDFTTSTPALCRDDAALARGAASALGVRAATVRAAQVETVAVVGTLYHPDRLPRPHQTVRLTDPDIANVVVHTLVRELRGAQLDAPGARTVKPLHQPTLRRSWRVPPRSLEGLRLKDLPRFPKGARLTATEAGLLSAQLAAVYKPGEISIRALASHTGRSYTAVHQLLAAAGTHPRDSR